MTETVRFDQEGFAGVFLPADRVSAPAVIYCDGAGNTPEEAVHNGSFLKGRGCHVLILGYYNWEGLPKNLSEVPVEYVEKAIAWLKKRLGHDDLPIGVAGMSAGGQYALLAASLIPEIIATAVASAYDYLVEGTDAGLHRLNRSPFSYRGKPLPYAPLSVMDTGMIVLVLKIIFDRKYGIGRLLRYGYDHSPVTEEVRIKVENISGSLLMLAAEKDDCLPAQETVRRVREKLRNSRFQHRVETYIYDKASHVLGCNFDLNSKDGKSAKKIFKAWKLYPLECEQSLADSMNRIVVFLREELGSKAESGIS